MSVSAQGVGVAEQTLLAAFGGPLPPRAAKQQDEDLTLLKHQKDIDREYELMERERKANIGARAKALRDRDAILDGASPQGVKDIEELIEIWDILAPLKHGRSELDYKGYCVFLGMIGWLKTIVLSVEVLLLIHIACAL